MPWIPQIKLKQAYPCSISIVPFRAGLVTSGSTAARCKYSGIRTGVTWKTCLNWDALQKIGLCEQMLPSKVVNKISWSDEILVGYVLEFPEQRDWRQTYCTATLFGSGFFGIRLIECWLLEFGRRVTRNRGSEKIRRTCTIPRNASLSDPGFESKLSE